MWDFLGFLTVYALFKMRGDRDPQATKELRNIPPMGDKSFAVLSFMFNVVGWGLVVWLIWLIL